MGSRDPSTALSKVCRGAVGSGEFRLEVLRPSPRGPFEEISRGKASWPGGPCQGESSSESRV